MGAKAVPGSLRGIEGLHAPLIGRDKEIETLRQVAAGLRQGRGGIVAVIGEAGIGESRLVQELRSELRSGSGEDIQWLEAQGVSYDTSRPYAFFSQVLRQAFAIKEDDSPARGRELSERGLTLARELKDHNAESKVLWNLMLVAYYKEENRDAAVGYGSHEMRAMFMNTPKVKKLMSALWVRWAPSGSAG